MHYKMINHWYKNKQKEIINKLIALLPPKTHISLSPVNTYYLPFHWAGFTIRPFATYRINDLSNIDQLYNNFGSVVKKNIKSAKNKVSVEESEDIEALHTLMQKTFLLQGRKYPYSLSYLKKINSISRANNAAKLLYAVDHSGNIHSGAFFLYDSNVCYYLIAGTDPEYRSSGANSLLIWEGIKFAAEHSRVFDFEGSMIEGIEHFVRQFGGEQTVYYDIFKKGVIGAIGETLKPYIKKIIHYK